MKSPLTDYLALFKTIPEEDKAILMEYFTPMSWKEGEILHRAGTVCREMFFICNGVLRIFAVDEKGRDVTHYFLGENTFCTILRSFSENVASELTIAAACDTETLVITRERKLAMYERLPYVKAIIDNITMQKLLDKVQTRNAYLGQDAKTRYQLFMMRQPDIALRVSLRDIASYLEITPQSLSRIRKNG